MKPAYARQDRAEPRRAFWFAAAAAAHAQNHERRERVLQHPDLAARLCDEPVSFTRPENWNGYIPPRTLPDLRPFGSTAPVLLAVNDSPVRAALVDIAAEAMRREGAQGE